MKYKITFNTGNTKGAGTDAKVTIKIFGTKNVTNPLILSSKFKDFERDKSDDFYIETSDLGKIEKLQIWHNDKYLGSNWFLDEVLIESHSKKKIWYFPVFKWLKKEQKISVKSRVHSNYQFEISTGTLPGSGTRDTIKISIVGNKTYTPFISINKYLSNGEFKTGHTQKFSRICEDVGTIEAVHVKSSGDSLNSNWFLSRIMIKNNRGVKYLQFPFHRWIEPNKVNRSESNLNEYIIKFHTGNVAGGGTDANVKMIMHGTKGDTKPIELNKLIARNAFEAGNIDYIKLAHKNLGRIKKITIWHDEKWPGDGWYLNKITVKDDHTKTVAEFPYYSWLDKSADPRSIRIELYRMPVQPRPFYAIAHMVNTPEYVEEALDLGSNAVEFDITPKLNETGDFAFDVFHGFRPDFDPDKINLMERSLARTPLKIFLENLRIFENKYPDFSLVIYDCKLDNVDKKNMQYCGAELAEQVIDHFYENKFEKRIYTIFSIAKDKYIPLLDGILSRIPKEFSQYIGFDLSMENFKKTERIFEKRGGENYWWGNGIASMVPKPLKHFIPQFLIAANKRAKREIIKKIYYWTLDHPDSMARILVTKLDGIIVNDPLKLLNVLRKEEFKYTYRLANRQDNPFIVV